MTLSKRLQTLLDYVEDATCLMDVGTDHGYLAIQAIQQKKAHRVLATDNKPGPLSTARLNVAQSGFQDSIELILADGLDPLTPAVDTLVIAGMGGGTIANMFEHKDLQALKKIIVQPTHQVAVVRDLTNRFSLKIADEQFLEEQGQTYTILVFTPGHQTLNERERLWGPVLLQQKSPLYHQALKEEALYLKRILTQIPGDHSTHPLMQKARILEEILDEWTCTKSIL